MTLKALGGFALAAVAAIAVYVLRHAEPTRAHGLAASAPEAPVAVRVATAALGDMPLVLEAVGRVEAKASVLVKPRIDGQVAEVVFREGSLVRRGQALFRLDPSVLLAQQRQAEALIARDEAQVAKLEGDVQRQRTLAGQGFISSSGLSQVEADLRSAQATVKADRAALDSARLQLSFTQVFSPLDGVAGAAQIPLGGSVKANDTTLVVVNQVQPVYVSFPVPESQLAALRKAAAQGAVPVSAVVEGASAPFSGTLAFVDNAIDRATGSILAKGTFANEGLAMTPGQFAHVTVRVGTLSGALHVPAAAIESGVQGPYAYVVKADSTVELRHLVTTSQSAGEVAVVKGLSAGERVVVSNQARLRDKAHVAITASAGGASAP